MNMRQARAYVLRCLAAEARHHEGNGSEWLSKPLKADNLSVDEDDEFNKTDYARVCRALRELSDELERRSRRLSGKPSR